MALRELLLQLGVKVDKNGQKQAEDSLTKIKKGAQAVAAVFAAGFVFKKVGDFVDQQTAIADSIDKTSSKLGLNAQELQKMQFAGEQTGVSIGSMNSSLERFTRRAAEASVGSGEAKDAFKDLGIKLTDSTGKLRPVSSLMNDVSDAIQNTDDSAKRVALAFDLFGREGVALVNTLKGGSEALNAFRKEAEDLGFVMDDEFIKKSVELVDSQNSLNKAFRGLKLILATELVPMFLKSTKAMIKFVVAAKGPVKKSVDGMFRAFKILSDQVKGITKGIAEFTSGMLESVGANEDMAESTDGISTALEYLRTILLGVGTLAVITAIKVAVSWGLATLPVLLLIAALGLLADEFLAFSDPKRLGFIEFMVDGFKDMRKEAGSWSGVFIQAVKNVWEYWSQTGNKLREGIFNTFKQLALSLANIALPFVRPIEMMFKAVKYLQGIDTTGFGKCVGHNLIQVPGQSTVRARGFQGAGGTNIGGSKTNIEINVDASGGSSNADVGDVISEKVNWVLEKRDRELAHVVAQ